MKWQEIAWRNRFYVLGAIGWAVVAWHYPLNWQMPVYAGY